METVKVTIGKFATWPILAGSALTLGLMISGCASGPPKIQTEHDSTINFSAYKTFAVLKPRATGTETDPGAVVRLTEPAMDAVREALTAKGMTEAPLEKADFAVRVSGKSLSKVDVTDWGYPTYATAYPRAGWVYGPGAAGYGGVDVHQYTERTLIVDVYDNATHKPAWVGWSEHTGDAKVEAEPLKQAIRNILAQFPPTTAALPAPPAK